MSKRSVSDSYLMKLWRRAVLINFNNTCPICGHQGAEDLQCHHVVFRRHAILRYDWRNGIPLCNVYHVGNQRFGGKTCHQYGHTRSGEQAIRNHVDMAYLERMELLQIKDYILTAGMSRNEFLTKMADDLKKKIEQGY